MNKIVFIITTLIFSTISSSVQVSAQEYSGPVRWNPFHKYGTDLLSGSLRTTAATLTLPFFEDFTSYSAAPDSNQWTDFHVYINNTMAINPISRGVATFDDLNANGIPYDSFSNTAFRYADSLTSQFIDLSADSTDDSVYLSFFYQPQGNGFFPLIQDSLMLFFKNRYGDFVKVWAIEGNVLQPFRQVMIPITDSLYFHNAFQFRFVNIAALYWADAVWNVDYIRLDRNRSSADTIITDVAFTSTPSFLLNDYTFMPYSQFRANPAGEIASQVSDSIKNNGPVAQSVNYSIVVHDGGTGATLATAPINTVSLGSDQSAQVIRPLAISPYPPHPANTSVVFRCRYFLQTSGPIGSLVNDTVIRNQVFDNYLAYDDGTAEKSYYLNLFPSLSGKIAIEHHLNHVDTLRGMAIYFGRQIPFANSKIFAIYVYSALRGVNGAPADVVIDSTDLLLPAYADSVNHFWYYTFDRPLIMPAGTFYAGTMQPFGGSSDSLYFGLDVNRVGGNHAYYNVLGHWTPSLISGAIMMRPLLGRYVSGSSVHDVPAANEKWKIMPNPATDKLQFKFEGDTHALYRLTDVNGNTLMDGRISNGKSIDISDLAPGMYFVSLISEGIPSATRRIIKL